jgi:hypothetical protein
MTGKVRLAKTSPPPILKAACKQCYGSINSSSSGTIVSNATGVPSEAGVGILVSTGNLRLVYIRVSVQPLQVVDSHLYSKSPNSGTDTIHAKSS